MFTIQYIIFIFISKAAPCTLNSAHARLRALFLITDPLCGDDPTEKTTLPFMYQTRGVFRVESLTGTEYRPRRHLLLTVRNTWLSGSTPVSVTGRPDRWMSLSLPQTSSDIRVRAGPSSPVEGSDITMKHGPLVNASFFLSKNRAKTSSPLRALREANLYDYLSSHFMSLVAPSRNILSRSDFQFARFTAISIGVRLPDFRCSLPQGFFNMFVPQARLAL
jgi:hypothetical protein